MPAWLIIVLVAATAAVVREFVLALRPPHPAIELGDRLEWRRRRAWRLRAVAALATFLAVAARQAYRAGWRAPLIDAVTTILLCFALALVLVSVWIYLRRM